MNIRVQEYVRPDGSCPYKRWFDRLDAQAAAKVVTAKLRLELGNTSNVKWFAGIGECIINWGPGYRVYLAKDGVVDSYFRGRNEVSATGRHRASESPACRVQSSQISRDGGAQVKERIEVIAMALTRNFKKTVVARVERDPAFARALLDEAATLFLSDEPETARVILRDLVNATMGFEQLAKLTDTPSKSLHRMLSPKGNPSMDNLAAIFGAVGDRLKVDLKARSVKAA
jgi:putative component of toxin-antitoxin plasmid stabilization module/DNA-binding phage protein